ncbi:MAG: hypothetical protein ACR2PX_02945 [Endozoicomonas sp.]|uniref:hypothetical protein n=1 Tax=Endozoicomonas sp. TaxID=1892382 RepID=UPI003D9B682E
MDPPRPFGRAAFTGASPDPTGERARFSSLHPLSPSQCSEKTLPAWQVRPVLSIQEKVAPDACLDSGLKLSDYQEIYPVLVSRNKT